MSATGRRFKFSFSNGRKQKSLSHIEASEMKLNPKEVNQMILNQATALKVELQKLTINFDDIQVVLAGRKGSVLVTQLMMFARKKFGYENLQCFYEVESVCDRAFQLADQRCKKKPQEKLQEINDLLISLVKTYIGDKIATHKSQHKKAIALPNNLPVGESSAAHPTIDITAGVLTQRRASTPRSQAVPSYIGLFNSEALEMPQSTRLNLPDTLRHALIIKLPQNNKEQKELFSLSDLIAGENMISSLVELISTSILSDCIFISAEEQATLFKAYRIDITLEQLHDYYCNPHITPPASPTLSPASTPSTSPVSSIRSLQTQPNDQFELSKDSVIIIKQMYAQLLIHKKSYDNKTRAYYIWVNELKKAVGHKAQSNKKQLLELINGAAKALDELEKHFIQLCQEYAKKLKDVIRADHLEEKAREDTSDLEDKESTKHKKRATAAQFKLDHIERIIRLVTSYGDPKSMSSQSSPIRPSRSMISSGL